MGGCLSLAWTSWRDKGAESWVVEVLREGYKIPFHSLPPLSKDPRLLPSYSPSSIKGRALREELLALESKGALEPAPPSPGFYSRMFVVTKASGGWRPIIDLSHLNKFVAVSRFKMETVQSVISSIRPNDWMVSIDLKDAYLQVPIHPDSRKHLRFVTPRGVFQFRVLCFGLSTAPQVFTRVMAPVSVFLHTQGVRMLRYLDDWLIQASSESACLQARDLVLKTCHQLNILVNLQKSHLEPTRKATYLGMVLDSTISKVFPTQKRQDTLLSIIREFLSSVDQPAALWRSLLGHLSSLTQIVPGGRLRMRALQFALRRQWDYLDDSIRIPWDQSCRMDLDWWADPTHLGQGMPIQTFPPDLLLWTDASDEGWGAHLDQQFASGLWSAREAQCSINWRELRAIRLGLLAFQSQLIDQHVGLFCDNTTAIAYLRKQGGTVSENLNEEAQAILRWAEGNSILLSPQFILGRQNVVADSLSRSQQVIASEWTLCQQEVDLLLKKWPATVDLFATSLNNRLPVYYSPIQDPQAIGVDSMLHSWNHLQAYAFPPFALIRPVLNKIRQTVSAEFTLVAPLWPQKEWFPDLLDLLLEPPVRLPRRVDLLRQPHFHRFHQGLPSLNLHAWRLSSNPPCRRASLERWLSSFRRPDVPTL